MILACVKSPDKFTEPAGECTCALTCTHAHTHARTHAYTHAQTHTYTHTYLIPRGGAFWICAASCLICTGAAPALQTGATLPVCHTLCLYGGTYTVCHTLFIRCYLYSLSHTVFIRWYLYSLSHTVFIRWYLYSVSHTVFIRWYLYTQVSLSEYPGSFCVASLTASLNYQLFTAPIICKWRRRNSLYSTVYSSGLI